MFLATAANAIGADVGIIVDDIEDDVVSTGVCCNDGVVTVADRDELMVVATGAIDVKFVLFDDDAACMPDTFNCDVADAEDAFCA